MKKLLLAAVCVVALTAGAQATPPIDSFVCTEVKVSSPDDDKDPTERIEVTTGIIQGNEDGIEVTHVSRSGIRRTRSDQYTTLRRWTKNNANFWSGKLITNPKLSMIGEFKITGYRRGTYTEKLYDGNGKLDFVITSKCVWVSHGELLESREPGAPSQSAITKLGTVDNTWGIEYNSNLFAGACIATVKYVKIQFSFLTAYPTEGTDKLWYITISNPEWTWIKKDAYYDLMLAVQRRNDPRRDIPVTFQGFNGQFMVAKVNVDIVNSMASDYGDIRFNLRNPKNNEWLSKRDSWNLGKSAGAIRTIVNCLKDRQPTVATTTPPPPTPPPPPGPQPPSQNRESKSSVGSGFFVSKPMGSADAYVVTNFHVIDGCKSGIRVRYPIYQPVNAYVHAADPANDLALLSTKLPANGFPSFRLNLKHGEQIASYGFPYGADFASFTMGNVTSVVGLDNNTSAFQMSAPVQPGNSGGPLLDMNGRVVGMAQGILGTLRAAEALGGAIPQNVNFGITATTIIGFLQAHSVDYRVDTERTKFEPEQIAEEAKKFTVKVTCGG
jgi:S1-C subfamily serine protease